MEAEDIFISTTSLICEPVRAKMLWNLLDGRAYTAGELAIAADISATSASNHLSKLLEADILKVESQGRHRYYSFSKPEVAYVVESLANLGSAEHKANYKQKAPVGIKYCRTCYDHLAGFVSVKIVEALEQNNYLTKTQTAFHVSDEGWLFFAALEIQKESFTSRSRPLARQCLDWSERKPHLAGQLGAALLEKMLERKWFKKVQYSRELVLTLKGREELYKLLSIVLP
ncbi:MAG TPA: helix-turn-helix transcriptional regulator [Bacteroidales bacterium]|nr:helix-turn-helix transcriptional regulator [Bacteroidales bacterium]